MGSMSKCGIGPFVNPPSNWSLVVSLATLAQVVLMVELEEHQQKILRYCNVHEPFVTAGSISCQVFVQYSIWSAHLP